MYKSPSHKNRYPLNYTSLSSCLSTRDVQSDGQSLTVKALVGINLLDDCGFGLLTFGFVDTRIDFEQAIEKFLRV